MCEKNRLIIVRGAGDISSGTIHRLHRAGFPVLALETERPSAIRREVSFSEAVYDGQKEVEGVIAVRIHETAEAEKIWKAGCIPLLVDPEGSSIGQMHPRVLVDAILAKKNTGTHRGMAQLTVALGPGFTAGEDVDYVIETMRGHDLGRIISCGSALPNTGTPGLIAGVGRERVIHAPAAGCFISLRKIGDYLQAGDPVGYVLAKKGKVSVCTKIDGILRGILRDDYPVTAGFKTADVDPRREEYKNCFTISDKARCIAGSVLELACSITKS